MLLQDAISRASEIADLLEPACERIIIAGSIRREKREPKDIELLAIPRRDVNLLDEPEDTYSELNAVLAAALKHHVLAWGDDKRDGPKWKRFRVPRLDCGLDLFLTRPETWGNQLAIRTGCGLFSKWFMTSWEKGGPLRGLRHDEGRLWRDTTEITCPTEEEFFQAIGVRWFDPAERTDRLVEFLWKDRAYGLL